MFYGREDELKALNNKYLSGKGEFIVVYGRRRVGKSALIKHFSVQKPNYFKFEGLEGESTRAQISEFAGTLQNYVDDKFLANLHFDSWHTVFAYVTEKLVKNRTSSNPVNKKIILFFDEIQWMAAGRAKLISIIKSFWDNHWKDRNVMLILCGSIASFMVKKIIHSKALYGRITQEILLKGLPLKDAVNFFKNKRSSLEILQYMMIFGGIPRYLEEINLNKSFNQNVNQLCFSKNGLMINEITKIFYSQFREVNDYKNIAGLLKDKTLSLKDISINLKRKSGGSLKALLDNLSRAELIESVISIDAKWNTKFRKYRLSDAFLIFFYKFIEPNLHIIKSAEQTRLFEKIVLPHFQIWMGFSFERFCLKHAGALASVMGFHNEMLYAAPYFKKNDKGFQIDMVYKRADKVIVVCEIKYHNKKLGTTVIPEVERKIKLLEVPRGYTAEKALISLYGPDKHLKDSEFFNYHVTLKDIFN